MPDLSVDPSHPVLVTGATGYVAGVVIRRLLEEGVTVHATVRDPSKTDRLEALQALADASPGSIAFFGADLMKPGSFGEGMAGCSIVFHIASPFSSDVSDPQRELVAPALEGTRNVLEEVGRTPSVQRVVLTSSCAAIYGDSADLADTPDGVFNEEVWNTTSSLTHGPYSYSKTVAEREAWSIAERQERWTLVVVNPSFVVGPGIKVHRSSESFSLIKQMGDGTFATGVPDLRIGVVDVRDLAEAQLRAAYLPGASGRHIISGHNSGFVELASILREGFSGYPIPTRSLPKWLLWLVGPIANRSITRRFVTRNVGLPWKADHSKSVRELGVTYRPLRDSLHQFFQQIIDAGELPAR